MVYGVCGGKQYLVGRKTMLKGWSIMIEKLTGSKQLFFTTHNTEILDMQLPKHTFTFLKKDVRDIDLPIKCIHAEQYLKRNTDSLKNAVENDLFCTAPELHKLYEIADL